MANTKSARKNIRKNKARYLQNRAISSKLKTLEKNFLDAITEKNANLALSARADYISALDKASKSNLVHPNKVSRKKSRACELLLSISA